MTSEPQTTTESEREGVAAAQAAAPPAAVPAAPAQAAAPPAAVPAAPAAGTALGLEPAPESRPAPGEQDFGDAAAPPAVEPPAEVDSPGSDESASAQVEPVQDDAQRYLALAQRTQADFDNFRKRAARDAALAGDRGVSRVVKELLPALDHLELALQAAERHEGAVEFAKGVRLVQDELGKALGRVGVEAFSPHGERFDPEQHEAMAQQPAEGAGAGTVILVYQQGYRLNGAVLRPARVVVAA